MPGDPNIRRDRALENIVKELGEIAKLLAKIERNTRKVTIKNNSYLEYLERRDDGTAAGLPAAGSDTDFTGP